MTVRSQCCCLCLELVKHGTPLEDKQQHVNHDSELKFKNDRNEHENNLPLLRKIRFMMFSALLEEVPALVLYSRK